MLNASEHAKGVATGASPARRARQALLKDDQNIVIPTMPQFLNCPDCITTFAHLFWIAHIY